MSIFNHLCWEKEFFGIKVACDGIKAPVRPAAPSSYKLLKNRSDSSYVRNMVALMGNPRMAFTDVPRKKTCTPADKVLVTIDSVNSGELFQLPVSIGQLVTWHVLKTFAVFDL